MTDRTDRTTMARAWIGEPVEEMTEPLVRLARETETRLGDIGSYLPDTHPGIGGKAAA